MAITNLSWGDRLALIEYFKPSDQQACQVFNVSQADLTAAKEMRRNSSLLPTSNINTESYRKYFETSSNPPTSFTRPSSNTSPVTATKRIKTPKKRGRKGIKIKEAFLKIPTTPIPLTTFATSAGVSTAVLRQGKRFDTDDNNSPLVPGTRVRVKKDKPSGTLMIWREQQ